MRTHTHTQTQKKKHPWRCATSTLSQTQQQSSTMTRSTQNAKSQTEKDLKTNNRWKATAKRNVAFSFRSSCRVYMLSSLNALQLWGSVSLQNLLCLIDPGLFQWLVWTEHRTNVSWRVKKDLSVLIETFALLQTTVIVWFPVGSSTFSHRHCYSLSGPCLFKKEARTTRGQTLNLVDVLIGTDKRP